MTTQHYLYKGQVLLEFDEAEHAYRANGVIAQSVTTVLGVIAKPALVPWAAKTCETFLVDNMKPGVAMSETEIADFGKAMKAAHRIKREDAASIGTIVHDWCHRFGSGENPPLPTHPQAQRGVAAFMSWVADHKVKFERQEFKIYSRNYHYAGTCDFLAWIDGELCLGDLKTGSGIYSEAWFQVAAYEAAHIEENGGTPATRWIINLDKNTGKFVAKSRPAAAFANDFAGFTGALQLQKALEGLKAAA